MLNEDDCRLKITKIIAEGKANGLSNEEIADAIANSDEVPHDMLDKSFLIVNVDDLFSCFSRESIQSMVLMQINTIRMHSGQGTKIEIEELDLSEMIQNKPVMKMEE